MINNKSNNDEDFLEKYFPFSQLSSSHYNGIIKYEDNMLNLYNNIKSKRFLLKKVGKGYILFSFIYL